MLVKVFAICSGETGSCKLASDFKLALEELYLNVELLELKFSALSVEKLEFIVFLFHHPFCIKASLAEFCKSIFTNDFVNLDCSKLCWSSA